MLGRPRESARLGQTGLEVMRRYGIDSTVLVCEPDRGTARDRRLGRGGQRSARPRSAPSPPTSPTCSSSSAPTSRSAAATSRPRGRTSKPRAPPCARTAGCGDLRRLPRELALWERRWTDADQAVRDGLARARSRDTAQIRVWFCAKGLRAQAELAALARARRDADAVRTLARSRAEAASPSLAARPPRPQRSRRTPRGWLALAEAEYARARGVARPELWSEAAAAWERLERPPLAAYCRWRQAEALVAAGASRTEASAPLREAHAVAARIGAKPLLRELELLAQRARLDLAPPEAESPDRRAGPGGDPRPDAARGGGPDPGRPRLHEPRDRRGARHQRQDGQRPRLAHPAQARRAEPARGGRDRAPPRPAGHRRGEPWPLSWALKVVRVTTTTSNDQSISGPPLVRLVDASTGRGG